MHVSRTSVAILAIAAIASAQRQSSEFWNYASDASSNATSFADRHGVPVAADGYVYKGFLGFRALGNPATDVAAGVTNAGEFSGFTGVIQDQVGLTPEPYEMFVCVQDPANPGRPASDALDALNNFAAPSPTVLASTGPLGTTTTPPSTATAPVAWRVTFTTANPIAGLEADGPAWVGAWIASSAGGARDGLYVQGAWYGLGEFPKAGAPTNTSFESLAGGTASGVAPTPGTGRNLHMGLLTPSTVLETGAEIDPAVSRPVTGAEWGIAGRLPDQAGRNDGLTFRVRDPNNIFRSVVVLMNVAPSAGPSATLPGIPGYMAVLGAGLLPIPVASGTLAGGVFTSNALFPFPNPFPLPSGSRVDVQAVVLIPGVGVQLSNACTVREL